MWVAVNSTLSGLQRRWCAPQTCHLSGPSRIGSPHRHPPFRFQAASAAAPDPRRFRIRRKTVRDRREPDEASMVDRLNRQARAPSGSIPQSASCRFGGAVTLRLTVGRARRRGTGMKDLLEFLRENRLSALFDEVRGQRALVDGGFLAAVDVRWVRCRLVTLEGETASVKEVTSLEGVGKDMAEALNELISLVNDMAPTTLHVAGRSPATIMLPRMICEESTYNIVRGG